MKVSKYRKWGIVFLILTFIVNSSPVYVLAADVAEVPVSDVIMSEEPVVEEPVVEEPAVEEPAVEEPVIEEPVVEEPVVEEPVVEEPVVEEPIIEEPVVEEPVVEEPVDYTPIVTDPIDYTPIDTDPVDYTPIVTDPVDYTPIEIEPIDYTPIDEKPIIEDEKDLDKLLTDKEKLKIQDTKVEKLKKTVDKKPTYVEGEVLVKFKDSALNLKSGNGASESLNFANSKGLDKKEDIKSGNISVLKAKKDKDGKSETVEQMVERLKNDPNVEYVEPNYIMPWTSTTPNDTSFISQWGLNNTVKPTADIAAPEAWDIFTGSNSVIVGVLDSGVAYNHPDLINNMWDGSAGCKNENNAGITCPHHGWDFVGLGDDDPNDDYNHGTHVAGIIGAEGNNATGISGVNWNVKIMALKVGNYAGAVTGDVIKAIDFAINNDVKILNASYGGTNNDPLVLAAINRFRVEDGLFIAAAGNEFSNNDSVHKYPSDYPLDNIISVAATTSNDDKADFSNWGAISVDVAAPGEAILSTVAGTEVINEDFEGVVSSSIPSGWVTAGVGSGNWGVFSVTSSAVSSFGKVLYGDKNAPYLDNADTTITIPSMNLSGITSAAIKFSSTCDTENDPDLLYDYMQLEVSADGSSWISAGNLGRWNEYNSTLNLSDYDFDAEYTYFWVSQSIPSQFLTNSFTMRFRWNTDSSAVSADGCSINDLVVTKYLDGSNAQYDSYPGTSMAAPHVAGLAALIKGYNPNVTATQIKDIILTTGDPIDDLNPTTGGHPILSGKRINAANALAVFAPHGGYTADDVIPTAHIAQAINGSGTATISFKIKDGYAGLPATLNTFEYSVDGGGTWAAPTNGDASASLSASWADNGYQTTLDYSGSTYSFTWNTKHADLTGLNNVDQSDVMVRFKVNDGALNSPYVVSQAFAIDDVAPVLQSFTSDSSDGTYFLGALININANYDTALQAGSTISVTLDSGGTAVLNTIVGNILRGNYIVGANQGSSDLTVAAITSQSVIDVLGNIQSSTVLPATNVADGSNMIVDTVKPDVTIDKKAGQADPTDITPVEFTVVFDKPINTATFTAADIANTGTATIGAITVTEIAPNDDTTFNLSVPVTTDGTIILSIAAGLVSDPVGNTNTVSTFLTDNSIIFDNTDPTGYSVNFDYAAANNINQTTQSFTFSGAEIGATYNYSIDDTDAGTVAITGSGSIITANQQISPINVSSLTDSLITLTVYLTDALGNQGGNVSDTILKDTLPPVGYSATFAESDVNIGNQTVQSFNFSGATVGATYNFSIDDVNASTPAITGSGTIIADNQTVPGINVSSLDDGILTLTVYLTDPQGNVGANVTDTIAKETMAPVGYTVSFDQANVSGVNQTAISFTFTSAEVAATYYYSIDDTNGGTAAITGNGTIVTSTDTISPINLTSLSDGTLTLTVYLKDAANNQGIDVYDTIIKDVTAPNFTIVDGTAVGPVQNEVINITVADSHLNAAALEYGFSIDNICNVGDAYGNVFTNSTNFTVAGNHVDYLCVKATDTFSNIGYQLVGQLNTDNTAPTFVINEGVDAGPVKNDTINLTATDLNPNNASLVYGFSTNNVCDINDTYGTAFTNSTDFVISGNHTDYLCARGTDLAGNIGYQLVGQLNTDNSAPVLQSLTSTTANGYYKAGSIINITATYNEAFVAGSTINVTLDNGGTAVLNVIAGNTLSGNYTVSAGENSADLTVATITAQTITDTVGNIQNSTTLPITNIAGGSNIVIDTVAPSVTSTSPADGSDSRVSAALVINFIESIDLTAGTPLLTVTDDQGIIYNAPTWSNSNKTASISHGDWIIDTTHVITISMNNIFDLAGNQLTINEIISVTGVASRGSVSSGDSYGVPTCAAIPSGSIVVNGNATATNTREVTLSFAYVNAYQMMYGEDPYFNGQVYQTVATTKTFTLSEGESLKTVYVIYKSDCGFSEVLSDTIEYKITATPEELNLTELALQPPAQEGDLILHDPEPAPTLPDGVSVGQLVKRVDMVEVYFIDQDNRRHAFPNEQTFYSWYENFNNVQSISADLMAQIPLGSNVTMRPGTYLIKIATDPKVYAIEPYGVMRWVDSEVTAIKLYGADWASRVVDVADTFFINYQMGLVVSSTQHPSGSVIQYSGDTKAYYVSYGKKLYVSSDAFTANTFQNKFKCQNVDPLMSYVDGGNMSVLPMEDLMMIK